MSPPRAQRAVSRPLVDATAHPSLGNNICNPWIVVMPPGTGLGRYHLYFSHHKGTHLRLAWANALDGPWTVHPPGVLDLAASTFPDEAGLDAAGLGDIPFRYAHIASPQVIPDPQGAGFHMYFHGLAGHGAQVTRHAWSPDGLGFVAKPADLGPPYMRVARWRDRLVALAWGGELLEGRDWEGPFVSRGMLDRARADHEAGQLWRHPDLMVRGDTAHVLFTRIGDCPERIFYTRFDLSSDRACAEPVELLRPELDWEGGRLPPAPSRIGAAETLRCELRDGSFVTDESGGLWMVYVGGGESAIGLARLEGL